MPGSITISVKVHPRESDRFHFQDGQEARGSAVQHVLVEKSRCDAFYESASQSMDQAMLAEFQQMIGVSTIPSTSITLPRIDTFTMGQLLQLSMIVTWIESRLVESHPTELG
jgi:hypothetical protein